MGESVLLSVIDNQLRWCLANSWLQHSNNQGIAIKMAVLLGVLTEAGYPTEHYFTQWQERYDTYKRNRGRAVWRDIKDYM